MTSLSNRECQQAHIQNSTQTITYTLHGNCYINMTNRCTLRCTFCPKFNHLWNVKGYLLRLKSEPSVRQIIKSVGDPNQYKEVIFCGLGEPTLRLNDLLDIAKQLKDKGARIRLNTDGLANAVYEKDITPLLAGNIDALSISLNANNAQLYNKHCRPLVDGAFEHVQKFIRAAARHVPDITITAIDGLRDVNISACEKIATDLAVKFRRRILDEVG